jgi:hypothetical protein
VHSGITLADPYLKTSRAKEHLETLRQELNAFRDTKPCKFHSNDDLKNQSCRVTIELKDTPDRIPLIVGDIFYNLRAALDQLVWCLAKLTLAYPRKTQFPILGKLDDTKFAEQTVGVPAEAAAIIKSLQPYTRGDAEAVESHLLWRLNKMCIIDKHMRIPVHSSVVDFHLPASIMGSARFDSGGVMNIPLSAKPLLKRYMALNPDVSFNVVFGDSFWGIDCDLEGIDAIYNFVADKVIPRFARFFE